MLGVLIVLISANYLLMEFMHHSQTMEVKVSRHSLSILVFISNMKTLVVEQSMGSMQLTMKLMKISKVTVRTLLEQLAVPHGEWQRK